MEKKASLKSKTIQFFLVSGFGWLLDFSIFTCLVKFAKIEIFYANCMSSLIAVIINRGLFSIFHNFIAFQNNVELITKVLITPITMLLNFIAMKYLIEKL